MAALFVLLAAAAVSAQVSVPDGARYLPASGEVAGWISAGPPESYEREGLYGYINGGSEVFLQYDFRRVDVGRYRTAGGGEAREAAVDLYRMGSPREAFGIFSIRRGGGENAIDLGDIPNWISESQASLAAGVFYVNIIGFGTREEDLAAFVRHLAGKLAAAGEQPFRPDAVPGPWSVLPRDGRLGDTLRLIQGDLAAREESEILAPDFWKFSEGTTAASAKYAPDGRRLIILDFGADPTGLPDDVRRMFGEYLTDVRLEGGVVSARNGAGHLFLFAVRGRRAVLLFGKKDENAARSLFDGVLQRSRGPIIPR